MDSNCPVSVGQTEVFSVHRNHVVLLVLLIVTMKMEVVLLTKKELLAASLGD